MDVQFNMVKPGLIVSSTRLVNGFIRGSTFSGMFATTPSYSFKTSWSLQTNLYVKHLFLLKGMKNGS